MAYKILGPAEYALAQQNLHGLKARGYRGKQRDAQAVYAAVARDAGKSGAEIYHPDYISPETGQNAREQFTALQQGIVLPRIPIPSGAGIQIPGGGDGYTNFAELPADWQPSGQSSGNRGLPMPAAASTPAYSTSYSEPTYSKSYADRAQAAITTPSYAGNYSSVPQSFMPSWMRNGNVPADPSSLAPAPTAPAPTQHRGLLPTIELDREHSSVPEHLMPSWMRGQASGDSDMIPPEWRGGTGG